MSAGGPGPFREAVVDLGAIRANIARIAEEAAPAAVMAVVKADAYGHGALPVARAALEGGARMLGVADVDEALALRAAGVTAPILAWLHDPGLDFVPALEAGIAVGVSSAHQLEQVAAAVERGAPPASVHLKVDTGLSRNGVEPARWDAVVRRARELEASGLLTVDGVFSHLANASDADDDAQLAAFRAALEAADAAGLRPGLRHLASTAAALRRPDARFDLVRVGIGMYGLTPYGDGTTGADLGLVPAMTLRGRVAAVRRIAAGAGVSYDLTWRAGAPTTLALVPLGYADGVPRHASGTGRVLLGGEVRPIVGRVAMDQFLVDAGDAPVATGDEVVLFGDPASGAPTADEWADAAGTIGYEIVTRIGPRVPRTYREAP
ncbi:alanine racemase [Agromyces rhizosphaerae]|uniref:Alanine racemase n=1 Tax=Agromyces rhizosphaerae TaxID=88374 RepID=A0A9W6CYI0_9MICO|nr:alanine racemase [Agromyces rhizosphaerae]GLI27995.1 alanine racemase [Agromyces rhizosphaerae]